MAYAGGERGGQARAAGEPDPAGVQQRHPGWTVTPLPDGTGYQAVRGAVVLTGRSPESLEGKITRARGGDA